MFLYRAVAMRTMMTWRMMKIKRTAGTARAPEGSIDPVQLWRRAREVRVVGGSNWKHRIESSTDSLQEEGCESPATP